MSCKVYNKDLLKPLGKRCFDIRPILLEIGKSEQDLLFKIILESLYFDATGEPHQKKAVVASEKEDFTDGCIIFVLLEGSDNLGFIELVESLAGYLTGNGYNSVKIGNVHLIVQLWNKCFCDKCLWQAVSYSWMADYHFRILVFDDFYISLYQHPIRFKDGIKLTQQAIKSLTPTLECCEILSPRMHAGWLGNGVNVMSSTCARAKKTPDSKYRMHVYWTDLIRGVPWLVKEFGEPLQLYTPDGFVVEVNRLPSGLKGRSLKKGDICFIWKYHDHYKITNYNNILYNGVIY